MKEYKYELVTDLDGKGIVRAMLDGEVFYNKTGSVSYYWDRYVIRSSISTYIHVAGKFYRKVEVKKPTRQEIFDSWLKDNRLNCDEKNIKELQLELNKHYPEGE